MHSVTTPRSMPSRSSNEGDEWSAPRRSRRSDDHARWHHLRRSRCPQLDPALCHRDRDRGERFIDFDTFDVADFQPARSSAWRTAGIGPSPNMPGSTAPMPRSLAAPSAQVRAVRPNRAPPRSLPRRRCLGRAHCQLLWPHLAEGRVELSEAFQRCVGPVMLILVENLWPFAAFQFDRHSHP